MSVYTAAGCTLSISNASTTDATDTQAEFEALTYLEVGEIQNIGEFGDQVSKIMFTALSNRRVRKFKGSYDAGALDLTVGFDSTDTGQAQVIAARASDADWAFKVTLNDAGTGSPSSPTTFYFLGKVMARTVIPGDVETVVTGRINIELNSAIIEVPAV